MSAPSHTFRLYLHHKTSKIYIDTNMTTVSNISEPQQRSEELQSQGYEAVLPGAFCAPKQGGNGVY